MVSCEKNDEVFDKIAGWKGEVREITKCVLHKLHNPRE